MMRRPSVAVLGSGILGSCTALLLARHNAAVSLFDAAPLPFSEASHWNEGKIHLGYMYNADPSLNTARRMLPTSLLFKPIVEQLIGRSLDLAVTPADDLYLCHAQSVVDPDAIWHYLQQVDELIAQHPDARNYLVDIRGRASVRLSPAEWRACSPAETIVAGFCVPERSVCTSWVARQFREVLATQAHMESVMGTRILAVKPRDKAGCEGPWYLETSRGIFGPFDAVVNALWEGKLAIDATVGLPLPPRWSHRYRRALFARSSLALETIPSAVIITGPFGDIKNYNHRDFYLSWYPRGLVAYETGVMPPTIPDLAESERQALIDDMFDALQVYLPEIAQLRKHLADCRIEGGWVYAAGQGLLSDRSATLHKRSDFGIEQRGTYFSVDTGKYGSAPWLAQQLVARLLS